MRIGVCALFFVRKCAHSVMRIGVYGCVRIGVYRGMRIRGIVHFFSSNTVQGTQEVLTYSPTLI